MRRKLTEHDFLVWLNDFDLQLKEIVDEDATAEDCKMILVSLLGTSIDISSKIIGKERVADDNQCADLLDELVEHTMKIAKKLANPGTV